MLKLPRSTKASQGRPSQLASKNFLNHWRNSKLSWNLPFTSRSTGIIQDRRNQIVHHWRKSKLSWNLPFTSRSTGIIQDRRNQTVNHWEELKVVLEPSLYKLVHWDYLGQKEPDCEQLGGIQSCPGTFPLPAGLLSLSRIEGTIW